MTDENFDHHDFDATPARASRAGGRRMWPVVLIAALLAFALGMIGSPWFAQSVRRIAPFAAPADPSEARLAADRALLVGLDVRLRRLEQLRTAQAATLGDAGNISSRLSGVERKLAATARLADTSSVSASAGARATRTALLLASVRRAVEAGRPLDDLAPAVRAEFGSSSPRETAALLALGAAPVTLPALRAGLTALREPGATVPLAASTPAARVRAFLGSLVRVHHAVPPATGGLQAAELLLNAGDADAAARALLAAPPRDVSVARTWAAAAHRYGTGLAALAALEARAVADPELDTRAGAR